MLGFKALLWKKGEMLRASHFFQNIDDLPLNDPDHEVFEFRVLETPIVKMFKSALSSKRPETVAATQLRELFHFLITYVIWVFLAVCFAINVVRFLLIEPSSRNRADVILETLFNYQFYAVLPLLPLTLPALCLVARSYGNAQIVCLFDVLQSSKQEFKDEEDIDEFDAAPPPTKDVRTDWGMVWRMFIDQLVKVDVSFLARTTGLVESLASTTVICALDREGSLSMPYPSVDSLFFLNEDEEPIILDMKEDSTTPAGVIFEEKNWVAHMNHLKPMGLNILLNTRCGLIGSRRRNDVHRRSCPILSHDRGRYVSETCLCRISRLIGFSEGVTSKYTPLQVWQTIQSGFSQDTDDIPDYHYELAKLSSEIFVERSSGLFFQTHCVMLCLGNCHLFTDGDLNILLKHCGEFWNGKGVSLLSPNSERKIMEFFQGAMLADMNVVSFGYRPLGPFGLVGECLARTRFQDTVIAGPVSGFLGNMKASTNELFAKQSTDPDEFDIRSRLLSEIDGSEPVFASTGLNCTELLKGQTFIGMASLFYQPKPNVTDFIEDLSLAGIRFVYFSSAPERESKSYAERLGLEIDWNSCILLSSSTRGTQGYLELHDMKAKLPRGVENIRSHLRDVDDVPLHVSLFAECSPDSIREMVKIFQENGEIVCCIGSSLNQYNVDCFALADIAIAVDPFIALKARSNLKGPVASLVLSSRVITSPCALKLHFDTSLYSLAQIIREARTLVENGTQAFAFIAGSQFALSVMMTLSYLLLLPELFTGYQVMWLLWIVLPIQTLPFLFSPHDPDVMKFMPRKFLEFDIILILLVKKNKNHDHKHHLYNLFIDFVLRFSLTIIGCVAFYILSLWIVSENFVRVPYGRFGLLPYWRLDLADFHALNFAQKRHFRVFHFQHW
ncbi:hypothetical protein BC829DRAFT_217530 [Chytridium lagenaria]|nr:hypothetical protein BC829DRAFT_217530 [Chytridium lagenaria]